MKRTMGLIILGTCLLLSAGVLCAEDEKPWSIWVDVAGNSKYESRGAIYSNVPVLQPGLGVSFNEFSLGAWSNIDLMDDTDWSEQNDQLKFKEIDLTLDYTLEKEKWSLYAAAMYYLYPTAWATPYGELSVSGTLNTLLSPTLALNYEIPHDGYMANIYANLGISHSIEELAKFGDSVTLGLELGAGLGIGSAGHNDYYYFDMSGGGIAGLADLTLTASLPVALGDYFTLTPAVSYSILPMEKIRDASGTGFANVFGGLTLGFSY